MEGCILAWNMAPIGTKVELDGIGECTVLDRMNSRFSDPDHPEYNPHKMDYYMGMDVPAAKQWGVKQLAYNIL